MKKNIFNKILKQKKANAFWILLVLGSIFFACFLYVDLNNSLNIVEKDLHFKNLTYEISIFYAKNPAILNYQREAIKIINQEYNQNFLKTLGLNKDEFLKRLETYKLSTLNGCKFEDFNYNIWYNQKNVLDNKKLNDEKYSSCKPNFENNLNEKFQNYIKENLEKEFLEGLYFSFNQNDLLSDILFDLNLSSKSNFENIDLNIYLNYSKQIYNKKFKVSTNSIYPIKTSSYSYLLNFLSSNIEKFPIIIGNRIEKCIKDKDKNQDICIKEIIFDYIKENDKEKIIFKNYDIKISFIKEISKISNQIKLDSEFEFYGLNFEIFKKDSSKKLFDFAMILKDNIPYTLIDFKLERFNGIDNGVDIIIDEPRFIDDLSSFVVLYSYENFFEKDSNNKVYSQLISLLKNNQIPKNFVKTGILDSNKNQYLYSQNLKNLNLISSNNIGFENSKKIIRLYQIYNPDKNKYELLENNKDLYVFVFATDKNLNYYLNDVEENIKSIKPTSSFGPKPVIKNDENKIVLSDRVQNSILIQIKNYSDINFNHYDLYIIEKDQKSTQITKNCQNLKNCYFFDGKQILTKMQDFNILIGDNQNLQNVQNDYIKIDTNLFSNNLVLKANNQYLVYLVPNNAFDNCFLGQSSNWNLKKIDDSKIIYYKLENKINQNLNQIFFENILILDKIAPNQNDVIFKNHHNSPIYQDFGFLYFDWDSKKENDVKQIQATLKIISKNQKIISKKVTISKNKQILENNQNIKIEKDLKYQLSNFIFIDFENNKNPPDDSLNFIFEN